MKSGPSVRGDQPPMDTDNPHSDRLQMDGGNSRNESVPNDQQSGVQSTNVAAQTVDSSVIAVSKHSDNPRDPAPHAPRPSLKPISSLLDNPLVVDTKEEGKGHSESVSNAIEDTTFAVTLGSSLQPKTRQPQEETISAAEVPIMHEQGLIGICLSV